MINPADTAWLITATVLVLFMTLPGLGLFYAGLVQAKNILSVLMHCIAVACLVSVLWFAWGYSLAFSGSGAYLGDWSQSFLANMTRTGVREGGSIPETVFCLFQMTFAIITPGLIIGAFVERVKFSAVLLFSGAWLFLVYVPAAHWIWGGGWLAQKGVIDYAGGIVVHTTAGVSALVFAAVLGARKGFPQHVQPPHAPWMVMVGASMLWVGWFGFNAGSALASNGDAGMAALVTHLSAAVASLVWLVIEWVRFGKPSVVGLVTGTIAGLATVTPASGFVGPLGGIACGLLGGVICYVAVMVVKRSFRIDDSLDVFAVHGIGGMTGTLATALLLTTAGGVGLPEGRGAIDQLLIQGQGVLGWHRQPSSPRSNRSAFGVDP